MDKQNKPLSEWTLGEVQALCEKRNGDGCCDECPFANVIGNCTLRVLPEEWDLKEAPRLTEQEIAIMAKWVSRDGCANCVRLWSRKPKSILKSFMLDSGEDGFVGDLMAFTFPSVHPGESIELEECMGAGDGQ